MNSPRQIDLDGRVALITGGARGIGFAIAERLLAAGANVAIAARTQADLDRARDRLAAPERFSTHRCDVAEPAQVSELADAVADRFKRLDVLVCSHGVYAGTRSFLDISLDEYDRTMDVNIRGAFLCAQAAARRMLDRGDGGRILFISSMNAVMGQYGSADYDASKAALHGLTRSLAIELAPERVTVNTIAPGWVRTEMSAEELEHLSEMVMNPSRRVGEPADIARAALWLADPDNGYVTGSVVLVDGGQTAMLPLPWPSDRPNSIV
jgi:NAD(P)-dependent dehydrogenase (short-subunit alcohol dehydrogenase family)